jgi:hypothetical protein
MGSRRAILRALFATVCSSVWFSRRLRAEEKTGAPKVKGPSVDERLLFYPVKYPMGGWQPRGLTFEDVWLEAADGTKLHAWYCPCDRPRAVVLITHGNGGNIAYRSEWLKILQQRLKVAVLMLDYRGYGRSEGVPTVAGIVQDGQAARTKLAELAKVKESEIVLMGESLGGAVAVQLAAATPARALVLQSTFPSMRDVARQHYKILSAVVPKSRLNSMAAIKEVKCPLLQSHGTNDKVIDFASGEKLFAAANEPKRFVRLEDIEHNNWITEEYISELDNFLSSLPLLEQK